jgi:hypothetical protein
MAEFVRPVEWMLRTVAGGGVMLTAAGYLPPIVVSRAMEELGWAEDWIGAGNREDLTIPDLALRENMHQFKLLHRQTGVLLPTPKGRAGLSSAASARSRDTAALNRWTGTTTTSAAFARYSLALPSTRTHLQAI